MMTNFEKGGNAMADYSLSLAGWNGCFLVPADVVDRYIKLAPPDAVRALLYVLRHGLTHAEGADIAEALGITEACAEDALDYWVSEGLFAPSEKVISSPEKKEKDVTPEAPAVIIKSGKMPFYSNVQIREALERFPSLRRLFLTAEDIFARQLNNADINLLYGLFDWYGFSGEAVEQILLRCHAQSKLRPAAIMSVADDYYKHGAITKEAAEHYTEELASREAAVDETVALLHLTDHTPYAKERKAFETWRFTYGFGTDVVAEALDCALKNTESASYTPELLSYLNKVLQNWYKGGVKTAEEARAALPQRKEPPKKEAAKANRSYDLNEEAALAMKRFASKNT